MENEVIRIDENLKATFNEGYLFGKHRAETAQIFLSGYIKEPDSGNSSGTALLISGIDKGIKDNKQEKEIKDTLDEINKVRKINELGKDLTNGIENDI